MSIESGGPVVERVVYRPTLVLSKRTPGHGVTISAYHPDGTGSHLERSRHPADVAGVLELIREWLLEVPS